MKLSPLKIGQFVIDRPLLLAPMAGVSDSAFREVCSQQGAGLTVAEMLTCNIAHWKHEKNRLRQVRPKIEGPNSVQIAGSDPGLMAEAAILNVAMGADIIDINMGCPAKKVLRKAAGSALLKDPQQVTKILRAVVKAVDVPVTLKIRTGWSPENRNGVDIARLAEAAGIQMLTVHGRTRQCRFLGNAEYETIAAIKQAVSIPVIANGDIISAEKAQQVLSMTGADGLMIGRGAQGRPWIFNEIAHWISTGQYPEPRPVSQYLDVVLSHLEKLHVLYGDHKGVLFARKHVSAYLKKLTDLSENIESSLVACWQSFSLCDTPQQQLAQIREYAEFLNNNQEGIAA